MSVQLTLLAPHHIVIWFGASTSFVIMTCFVYIVRCKDNSLYTGSTRNIKKRINEHNFSTLGAKSIRGKRPVKLIYFESYTNWQDCLKREREIKGWRKEKKEALIRALALNAMKGLR